AKLMVDSFIKLLLADHRGSEVVYAALPGEALLSERGKETAKRLAEALIHGAGQREGGPRIPRCRLCGGDTFRFLDNGNVRCMVCSSEGGYVLENDEIIIETVRGDHAVFLSREDATKHFDFLRSMKDRFAAERKALKEAVREYHDIGEWIRPPKQ
ncbi:MAG: hypothetical protein V2B18_18030, partial [Pseudomonadota bacterium]